MRLGEASHPGPNPGDSDTESELADGVSVVGESTVDVYEPSVGEPLLTPPIPRVSIHTWIGEP